MLTDSEEFQENASRVSRSVWNMTRKASALPVNLNSLLCMDNADTTFSSAAKLNSQTTVALSVLLPTSFRTTTAESSNAKPTMIMAAMLASADTSSQSLGHVRSMSPDA